MAEFGLQIAGALARVHPKGLIHRDLKPGNVMVTPDGELKVLDFGLAALLERPGESIDSSASTLTTVAPDPDATRETVGGQPSLAGTLPYMSPEQARGEELDSRSDIFSLGVMLYEMTTGKRPFACAAPADLLQSISRARAQPPHELVRDLPLELDRIVRKALAARPSDRYQTMDDLAVDLKRLGRELESGSSPSYGDLAGLAAARSRRRLIVPPVAGALALLALGVWWFGFRGGPTLDPRTLLILPLEVRGQTADADYAGLAFAEALSVNLAQSKELVVLPVPRSVPVGDDDAVLAQARRSGAGRLLAGALTRDGSKVHARLTLTDVSSNRILWGSEGSEQATNLSTVASDLAREVVAELGIAQPKRYDYPTNLAGSPAMVDSPLLSEAIGALRRGEIEAGLSSTLRLIETFPDEPDALALRVHGLMNQWELDRTEANQKRVETASEALARVAPESPYPKLMTGIIHNSNRRPHQAIPLFDELLQRDDLTPALRAWIVRQRGWSRRVLGDLAGSLANSEESIRLDPTRPWSYAYLGQTLAEMGRREDSITAGRQAVALAPHAMNLAVLGHALSRAGRHEEAAAEFERACETGEAQNHCANQAYALHRAGLAEEASAAARRAMGSTDTRRGSYLLARYYALTGERATSIEMLRRAMAAGFSSPAILQDADLFGLHGDAEFDEIVAGLKRRALARARETLAFLPDSPGSHLGLGITLAQLESWNEAAQVLRTGCDRFRQQRFCSWLAVASLRAGRPAEARRAAEEASTLDDHPDGAYQLARFHALAGDRSTALSYLERSLEAFLSDAWITHDPDMESLRGEPRFEAVVAEVLRRNGESVD